MILSGLLEFLLGNTFQFILFCGYGTAFPTHVRIPKQTIADTGFPGSFWLALGATLTPYFGAYEHYSPDPTSAAAGLSSMGFNASFGKPTQSLKILMLTKGIQDFTWSSWQYSPSWLVSVRFEQIFATHSSSSLSSSSSPCLPLPSSGLPTAAQMPRKYRLYV